MVGRDDASRQEQIELMPVQRCDYCGPLDWTTTRYGQITHKCKCPHRTDNFCQAHPAGNCELPRPVENPHWPLHELPGETFEDIFKDAA